MELTRYDVYAQLDQSYDDEGHIDYAHAYIDYCEDKHGSWVSADDALALLGRITYLESQNTALYEKISDVSQQAYEAGLMDGANQ
jgi:hypothetical protein